MNKLNELAQKMNWTDEDVDLFIAEITKRINPHNYYEKDEKTILEERIIAIFIQLRIPLNIKGFEYTKEAIKQVFLNPELKAKFTTELYPMIAKTFHTTSNRVERSIRYVVEISRKGDSDILKKYFTNTRKGKPTTKEFINLLVEYLQLEKDLRP